MPWMTHSGRACSIFRNVISCSFGRRPKTSLLQESAPADFRIASDIFAGLPHSLADKNSTGGLTKRLIVIRTT